MDQQVSPAVVVIVLILIAAILVGLYFLVVEGKAPAGEEPPADVAAGEAAIPADAGAEPAAANAAEEAADQGGVQSVETGEEPSDTPASAEEEATGADTEGGDG